MEVESIKKDDEGYITVLYSDGTVDVFQNKLSDRELKRMRTKKEWVESYMNTVNEIGVSGVIELMKKERINEIL